MSIWDGRRAQVASTRFLLIAGIALGYYVLEVVPARYGPTPTDWDKLRIGRWRFGWFVTCTAYLFAVGLSIFYRVRSRSAELRQDAKFREGAERHA